MSVELIVGILVGLVLGGLAVSLWLSTRKQQLTKNIAQLEAEKKAGLDQILKKESEIKELQAQRDAQIEDFLKLTGDYSSMSRDFENMQERYEEKGKEFEGMQKQMRDMFDNLANRILDKSTDRLTQKNREQMEGLLKPLKDNLQSFEKKVESVYNEEGKERFHLKKEIEKLVNLNEQLSSDAQNLATALKGDSKAQGNWGEVVLARILESSGLRAGEEFVEQAEGMGLTDEEGRHFQPDVVIRLPEDKHLIVDSKVSLTHYERYVSSSGEMKKLHLKKHIESVQNHVKGLSEKHYQALNGVNSPDFVLMFMPIEAAFSLAIQTKPDLFTDSWQRKIVIVSPTTLLATLRTVSSVWKLERQNRNAIEIARQGGLLYDRLASFVEEMDKVGDQIDKARQQYSDSMKKLRDGKGNLIGRARKLAELGVPHKKQIEE